MLIQGSIRQISGTVISISDGGLEPADRNWLLFVFGLLLIVMLSYILLAWWLISRHSPGRGLFYGSLLFRRGPKLVPVRYFGIRDNYSTEHIVRVKGVLDGNVSSGDRVAVVGRLRGSTLNFSRGKNLTSGAYLCIRKRG